jgi:hypothetical protein
MRNQDIMDDIKSKQAEYEEFVRAKLHELGFDFQKFDSIEEDFHKLKVEINRVDNLIGMIWDYHLDKDEYQYEDIQISRSKTSHSDIEVSRGNNVKYMDFSEVIFKSGFNIELEDRYGESSETTGESYDIINILESISEEESFYNGVRRICNNIDFEVDAVYYNNYHDFIRKESSCSMGEVRDSEILYDIKESQFHLKTEGMETIFNKIDFPCYYDDDNLSKILSYPDSFIKCIDNTESNILELYNHFNLLEEFIIDEFGDTMVSKKI